MLSILIPVYNEKQTLPRLLDKVKKANIGAIKREIIIIDDHSTDGSKELIMNLSKQDKSIKTIFNDHNIVKAGSVKKGLKLAKGDFIIIQDADLEYDPNDYSKLLKPILDGKAEVVYGSRFLNKKHKLFGKDKTILPVHYIGNKFLNSMTNLLYKSNLTDIETFF